MKTKLRVFSLMIALMAIFQTSCKDDIQSAKTSVTFKVSDEGSMSGDCYYRIIEPVADTSTEFQIVAKYQKNVGWNGTYTFENVTPGKYGCIIGGIGNTYKDFTIAEGEHVTVTIRHYYAYSITTYYGTTVPVYGWTTSISK